MLGLLETAGLTAIATLVVSETVRRLCARLAARRAALDVQHPPERSQSDAIGVPSPALGTPLEQSTVSFRPPSTESEPVLRMRARAYVNAPEQVREFLDYMTAEGYARPPSPRDPHQGRYPHAIWWAEYLAWAERQSIMPLAETTFFGSMVKHPRIRRTRDRVLDQHGRALRNAAGTPIRPTNYTLLEIAPVEAITIDPVTGRQRRVTVQPHEVKQVRRQLKAA